MDDKNVIIEKVRNTKKEYNKYIDLVKSNFTNTL